MKKIFVLIIITHLSLNVVSQSRLDSIMITLGNSIERFVYNNNRDSLNSLFNYEIFYSYFLNNDTSNHQLQKFNNGFKSGFGKSFSSIIINSVGKDDYYNFINFSEDDEGNHYLRFRFLSEGNLSYHEFFVPNAKQYKFEITDVFFYNSGEYFSETLKQLYDLSTRSFVNNKNAYKDAKFVKNLKTIMTVKKLEDQGKLKEALKLLNDIPDGEFKESKLYLLSKLRFGAIMKDKDYKKLLNEYINKYPNSPSVYLWGIDFYILEDDYINAIKMYEKLYELTGDEYLYYYIGDLYNENKNYEKAEEYLIKFNKIYDTDFDGYELLLNVFEKRKKFEEAIFLVNRILDNFEISKSELIDLVKKTNKKIYNSVAFNKWKNIKQ